MKRCLLLSIIFGFGYLVCEAQVFSIVTSTDKASIYYDRECKLDSIAAGLLASDIELLTGQRLSTSSDLTAAKGNIIVIGSSHSSILDKFRGKLSLKDLDGKWECYAFRQLSKPIPGLENVLIITGSDFRGTAYGVFELSSRLGVSSWTWWADVLPQKRSLLTITIADYTSAPPSVQYRGIFINDEDWGLQPWAAKTFEKQTGDIGPGTYAKVFELLLRLKANMIWPAMHPSTKAFFHYPGNLDVAADYQIFIGSSHAEPMLRNNVDEWDHKKRGDFNYLTNKEQVLDYWTERVKQTSSINAIYSLGMRGIHDGEMEGVKNIKEAVPLVERIIQDERSLLQKYVNKDLGATPQVLTPYKEVLEIYDNGLKVPDDVTLVWPDDNYGYIQRLNNPAEAKRLGGAGVYYHASYWGRPHDYLWLPSANPSLMREEMVKAYNNSARKLWVLNVGDIKPHEYNIQQFLDMAYDISPFLEGKFTREHLDLWSSGIFGPAGKSIGSILWTYYQLAFSRKPEFMGWSRTEPITGTGFTEFNHFYFGDEAQRRLDKYELLESAVRSLLPKMLDKDRNSFYQLVYYPVMCASWMNKKFLYRDKAYIYSKQNRLSAYNYAILSMAAYDSIVKETRFFNEQLTEGKWKHIMSSAPRELPVYLEPVLQPIKIDRSISWDAVPEGYDTIQWKNKTAKVLPWIRQGSRNSFFIDVFLSDSVIIDWLARPSDKWIRISQSKGILAANQQQSTQRIWVSVDWSEYSGRPGHQAFVEISDGARNVKILIDIAPGIPGLPAKYNGFVEDNSIISMNASSFNTMINGKNGKWQLVSGLGHTGQSVQSDIGVSNDTVSLNPKSIIENSPHLKYEFYSGSTGPAELYVYSLPTHALHNKSGMRYAISVDGRELEIVNFQTAGRSEEWKKNVLRNEAISKIKLPALNPGRHTLTIYAIDPGVVLDRILIDWEGKQNAYSPVPETMAAYTGN
jgi:hypothetical protein